MRAHASLRLLEVTPKLKKSHSSLLLLLLSSPNLHKDTYHKGNIISLCVVGIKQCNLTYHIFVLLLFYRTYPSIHTNFLNSSMFYSAKLLTNNALSEENPSKSWTKYQIVSIPSKSYFTFMSKIELARACPISDQSHSGLSSSNP